MRPDVTIQRAGKEYSVSQMDNFYDALGFGKPKTSGVMNYIQHLLIAKNCHSGDAVLDICCGRSLLVPLLAHFAPAISFYFGVDISLPNLREARSVCLTKCATSFNVAHVCADATELSSVISRPFDVIAYTSSLEHLDRESGAISLQQAARLLSSTGRLYLSTPITPAGSNLQYRVHVHEWDRNELLSTLRSFDLRVIHSIGLLPPRDEHSVVEALADRFGSRAVAWYQEMRASVPAEFFYPVLASAFPGVANEVLYICERER